MLSAVITAGARVKGAFARELGTEVKALARVREQTMLDRAINAARSAGAGRIAVVGGSEIARACAANVERIVAEGWDGAVNVRNALAVWDDAATVLYLTSDMPYVDGTALSEFTNQAPEGFLAMPICDAASFERRFPNAPPFGVAVGGERVVNGGAFIIPAAAAGKVQRLAARFFQARKSVPAMAALLGPVLALEFLFHRLTIAKLERHAQRLLGVPVRAVRDAPPELAYDVDTLEEYRYAATHS